jgi:DNA-binding NtrC family response regulator
MLEAASSSYAGLPLRAAAEGSELTIEEALALAATTPDRDALPALLAALASQMGAATALLAPETRGEPGTWLVRRDGADVWTATLPVLANGRHLGTIAAEGTGAAPGEGFGRPLPDPRKLTLDVAVALALDALKAENRRLVQPGTPAPAPPEGLTLGLSGHGNEPAAAEDRRPGKHQDLFALFPEIVGRSAPIRGVLHAVLTASRSDIPVLIDGESGTGKELAAQAIHRASARRAHPFISENCGALPANLAESEFFGHERGSFTGAERMKLGLFERAGGGTVFLDEVGEMDLTLQRKLLRVLQEKEVRRVGGESTLPVDFRVISATNRVLEQMVESGAFRDDLYYRLAVTAIHMPALREREGDIPILVDHFSRVFTAETRRPPLEFTKGALEVLAGHRWPGNLRELRNEVWRLACGDRKRIEVHHLSKRVLRGSSTPARSPRPSGKEAPATPSLSAIERGAILEALRDSGGNRSAAARRLGIPRSSLYRKMRRYAIGS